MPTIKLNGKTEPALSCPWGKSEVTFWADDLAGFGLRCRASGARSWHVQYRTKTGDLRKYSLGDPATVKFAKARAEAQKLLSAVKLGDDPAAKVQEAKAAVRVGDLVDRYLDYQQGRLKARSYVEVVRHLRKHARELHGVAAGKVTQRDVVELLQEFAKTTPIAANRLRASLSAMFAWAMKSGLIAANPVTFWPAQEQSRDRVLSDVELALIWRYTATDADHDRIVRLLMMTGARREEIGAIEWSELTLHDDGTATWVLPARRSKNGRPHELLLPAVAAGLLPAARDDEHGGRRKLLFGEGNGPFSGWSRCKERLDKRITKEGKVASWVLHDLRRTFVTRLNDLGVEPHVIEALVNHVGGIAKSGVAGVYNRAAYGPQKRAALALWSDHIAQITGEGQPDDDATNVVPLREPRQ